MPKRTGSWERVLFTLWLAVACSLAASRTGFAISPNLVLNGTFVGGSGTVCTDWTFTAAASGSDFFYTTITSGPGGATIAPMYGATSTYYDTISQVVPTQVGQGYTVAFYLEGGSGGGAFYSQFGTGTAQYALTGSAPATWTLEQYTYVATSSSTTLTFGGYNPPSFYYATDVSVTALPEPPCALLVGVLVALLVTLRGAWMRREAC